MPEPPVMTAYELLHVDPAAPGDLLNTSYWLVIGDLQQRRSGGENVDSRMHEVTVAYQHVSEAGSRAAYNAALGMVVEDIAAGPIPKKKRMGFLTSGKSPAVDYYAVLGLSATAPARLVGEAFRIMRNQYLRLPLAKGRRVAFMDLLDEAYAVVSDESRRAEYDARRAPAVVTEPRRAPERKKSQQRDARPEAKAAPPTPAKTEHRPARTTARSQPAPAKSKVATQAPRHSPPPVGSPASSNGRRGTKSWLSALRPQRANEGAPKAPAAPKSAANKATDKKPARRADSKTPAVASVTEKVKPPTPKASPAPPVTEPSATPRPRLRPRITLDKTQVEEVLLGRLAASVKEHGLSPSDEVSGATTPRHES